MALLPGVGPPFDSQAVDRLAEIRLIFRDFSLSSAGLWITRPMRLLLFTVLSTRDSQSRISPYAARRTVAFAMRKLSFHE